MDDPGSELEGVDTTELVVVVELADVVGDPGGLGGEGVVSEGSDPGSAGVVDLVGQVPVEDLFDRQFAACTTQRGTERDEFLLEYFLLGRRCGLLGELFTVATAGFESAGGATVGFLSVDFREGPLFAGVELGCCWRSCSRTSRTASGCDVGR